MGSIRIAILSANNTQVAFMDNAHKKSMHYWGDELHEYLQGTANTYTFTVNAKHPDAEHVTVGNKVAFTYKGKSYYLNIVNTDQTEKIITATAWSLSFELINEDAGEYKAGKAMSFEEYLAIFDAERTLKLGLNEVSDKRITNEWTGTTSVLKRLFSLANVFSAEIEFETVLNRDYSLKEIVLNVYRKHSDTDSGVGEYRNDIVLRYGKGITGIRKTTDVESLYTCIYPTGKDGLTINGLDKKEYDASGRLEYFTDGALIRAPQARDRFPSNIVNKDDAYIMLRKEYDTDNQDKLYSMALSDLKTASEPAVTYEVDGYFDTNIGDTVRMQDQEWTPALYLQARVSEQVRSLTNPKTAKTVFSNYKELTSEISDDLIKRMEDLISKNKVYTCSISTNNGVIFKNGVGSTTLTAYAYNNGVDVLSNLQFRWSKDGQEFYAGRSVTVNAEDVDAKAVYSFVATENGIRRGYYEVTITKVDDGEPGKDGTTYYTWFKFADDEYGNGMSSSPDGKEYLGIAYNKVTPVMSNNPEDYQWARITGEGIPGKPGADGKTYYTWVRYADDARGNGMSDSPNGKYYIGFAYNKEVPTESNNPADYQWSKYKGDDGKDGTDGAIKSETPPDDKTKLWYDTVNNVLKYWDGEKWVEAYTGDIEDAKDAAGNAQESANTAISSVNNINTSLEKYKNEVRAEFKNTVTYVDGKTEVIDTWVRQGSDGVTPFLELGGTSNDLKARLTNSRLGFYEGDKGLAYFGNEKAYMPVAEVDNLSAKRVGVGNYAMLDNGDGHLSLIYIE
jgi:phage minor structural protein|nr:MAG TPA: tail protein [Caudoviricetes sp.]